MTVLTTRVPAIHSTTSLYNIYIPPKEITIGLCVVDLFGVYHFIRIMIQLRVEDNKSYVEM